MKYIITLLVLTHSLQPYLPSLAVYDLYSGQYHWWQPYTYWLQHNGLLHLGINCFALYSFGTALQRFVKPWQLYVLLLAGIMATGYIQALQPGTITVGASGAVCALLGAYAVQDPERKVLPLFIPISIFAGLFMLFSLVCFATHSLPGMAHQAHIVGMLLGVQFSMIVNTRKCVTGSR